jgi:uncharacterized protein (DUF2461 family)
MTKTIQDTQHTRDSSQFPVHMMVQRQVIGKRDTRSFIELADKESFHGSNHQSWSDLLEDHHAKIKRNPSNIRTMIPKLKKQGQHVGSRYLDLESILKISQ